MKKESLPIVEISRLSEAVKNEHKFSNELALLKIEKSNSIPDDEGKEQLQMRINGMTFVLITQGSIKISIDYITYEVGENTLLMITPEHIVQFLHSSSDVKGRMLVVSRSFLDIFPSKNSPSVLQYMYVRKNPCMKLEKEDIELLDILFDVVQIKLDLEKHNFHKEVLQVSLWALFLEIGNILWDKQENATGNALSRKEELFQEFLKILLEHVKEEHRVTFYAEKLFITPQYLSSILKELSGKPANKWIDDALILEAKLLLKAPQATVQEVADQLHFSDQSTFGKFFKKQVGLSPMEYRKS